MGKLALSLLEQQSLIRMFVVYCLFGTNFSGKKSTDCYMIIPTLHLFYNKQNSICILLTVDSEIFGMILFCELLISELFVSS